MATIVKLKESDRHAILIGVGYGIYKSTRPGLFFGNLVPEEQEGESQMAAVSTSTGDILWCRSEDLTVISVDGSKPEDLLKEYF